jgi:hypothetical protein
MLKFNEALQWVGALFIITGHLLNTMGTAVHEDKWNILAFALGTIAFLAWTIRVANRPQMVVNLVAVATCSLGLYRAWG